MQQWQKNFIIHIALNPYVTRIEIMQMMVLISSIIRGFKSKVTVRARKIDPEFAWQPGYYDRLIRDANEFNRIRKYILENLIQFLEKTWRRQVLLR